MKTVLLLIGFALASNHFAEAQQSAKIARIGFLSALSPPPVTSPANKDAFLNALKELGWIEGRNMTIEYRWAEGKYDRLPALAAELVGLNPDVIVTNASRAAVAAKHATNTIPIVFDVMAEPVSMGLVSTLAKPGGNLTGVSGFGPELSGKQVELIREVVPRLKQLAVLANPSSLGAASAIQEIEKAAAAIGIRTHVVDVEQPAELEAGFERIAKWRAEALIVPPDAMLATQRKRFLLFVEKLRLPAIYAETPAWVANGGLMSYSANLPDQFRKIAIYVDKILRGAAPSNLPVQQPTKFELMINLQAAKQIGLTIPPHVLARADRIIK